MKLLVNHRMTRLGLLGLGLVTVVACASTQEAPAAAPEAPAPAPESWDKAVTKEQKAAFMKAKVVPALAPVFKAEDASTYADFGCKTCHGPEYKLPRAFLPDLELKNNQLTAFAEEPQVAKFMAEKVAPKMAEVLGKPPFNPETHTGFGCGGCHAITPAQ
jgi:hypothetical protein